MSTSRLFLVLLLALASVPGQQMLWEIPPVNNGGYRECYPFSDFDRDGVDDILAYRFTATIPAPTRSLCVLSGFSGAVLYQDSPFYGDSFVGQAGDCDGDGYDEYVWFSSFTMHVHSPRLNQELFRIPPATGPSPVVNPIGGDFGMGMEPRIDLDGDGLGDLLAATRTSVTSVLYAFNHQGVLRYSIPALSYGWVIRSIANVGDRDGDGGEDFLVGAIGGPQLQGGAFLFSGRTGTLIRSHFGLQPFDLIGGFVANAGDFDRDGVPDLLASNEISLGSSRQITMVWSGATGAVLHVWSDPNFLLGDPISGRYDVDLDGVPDVLFSCRACQAPPNIYYGMIKALSSRDDWLLQETHAEIGWGSYGFYVADLGVRPGNPHPVYAVAFNDLVGNGGRLQVWRSEPPRSSITGASCSTTGEALVPGLRTTPTGSRMQIANAPPAALAWCILGNGTATTTSGLPLPVALDSFGFPGCSLLVPLDAVGTTVTGTTGIDRGYAFFDLPRRLAATAGQRFAVQWLLLDPASGFEAWTKRRDFWVQ